MLNALLALTVALLPLEREPIMIADFVDQPVDCVPRYYAGQTKVMCDLAPGLQRAVDHCESLTTTWTGDQNTGCEVVGANGLYYWGSTVSVCATPNINLRGAKILSASDVTLIRFEGFGRCDQLGKVRSGRPSLRDFYARPFSTTSSVVIVPAIEIHSPVTLERAHLQYFDQGVEVYANASATLPEDRANANSWIMRDVIVQGSLHTGVFVDGPDANVGVATSVKSTSNCTKGSATTPAHGQCADIFDGAFLGCTWEAASTGYAQDDDTNAVFPGIVLGDSANSRSVCVGCYIEGGYGGGVVAGTANVIGGIGSWTGGGNRLEGNRISGLEAIGSDGLISVKLGALTGGGALTLTPINATGTYPLRFKYDAATYSILLNVANVSAGHALRIGTSLSAIGGYGGLLLAPNSGTENVWLNHSNRVVSGQTP
jgi:hypothetical protein